VENETDWQRDENRLAAFNRYRQNIHDEEITFYNSLRDRWLGLRKKNCKAALETLGTLAHSWQDFYAHGIHSTGWESGAMIVDTPDYIFDFFPSSYSLTASGAEHPRFSEPPFSEAEHFTRTVFAEGYVKEQFDQHLRDWLSACPCACNDL